MQALSRALLTLVVLVMMAGAPAAFATDYLFAVIDFPVDLNVATSGAYSINANHEIVGGFINTSGQEWAYLRQTDGMIVPYQNNNADTHYLGINDNSVIVGRYTNGSGKIVGFEQGSATDLDFGLIATAARGINTSGQIVGCYRDSSTLSYGYYLPSLGGTPTTIDYGGHYTQAMAINNSGQIVGAYRTSDGNIYGFSVAYNNLTNPTNIIHGTAPDYDKTFAFGINDSGTIVGCYIDDTGCHGYIFADGSFETVDFPGPGGVFFQTRLYGITDDGWLVGDYYDNGVYHAFLAAPANPVPAPATLVLFGSGLLGLAGLRVRRPNS